MRVRQHRLNTETRQEAGLPAELLSAVDQTEESRLSLVTIGIPTYNRVEKLRNAVAAVQDQTYQPLKLVICDNASTDGTEAFVHELIKTSPWVEYIRQTTNLGPTANFESARDAATGDYFMWLADDDWIPPNYVAECVAVLEAEPTVVLAAGHPCYYQHGELQHEGKRVDVRDVDSARRILNYYRQVSDNGTFYGLYRLPTIKNMQPLRRRMGGDWLFVSEIAAQGEIRTLASLEIRRDQATEYSLKRIAETGGYSRFEGRFPFASIASFVAWELAFGSTVHRELGLRRFALAIRAAAIILHRFAMNRTPWLQLRRRARYLRIHAKRMRTTRQAGRPSFGSSDARGDE